MVLNDTMTLSEENQRNIPLIFTALAVTAASLIGQPQNSNWYIALALHSTILISLLLATNEQWLSYGLGPRKVFLIISFACVLGLQFFDRNSIVLIYTVMLSSILVYFLPTRSCYFFILFNTLAFLFIRYWHWDSGIDWREALIWSTFNIFAMIITQRMVREEKAREEISLINQQLETTQALLSQSAAENERLYMARELHDNVGHQLTALIIQLDIARRSVDASQAEPIEQSYQQAKALLASIREVVSNKRNNSDLDLHSALQTLCQNLPRIHCSLEYGDGIHITNVGIAQCILRCSQEAISNSLKHSFAGNIHIALHEYDGHYHLSIKDDGSKVKDINPGNGLKGISERCEELGGHMQYHFDQGFCLKIQLPRD